MLCCCCRSRSELRQGPKQNDVRARGEGGSRSERASPAPRSGVQTRSKGHSAGTGHFRTGQRHPTTPILSSPRFQIPISWKELDFRPLCLFLDPTKKQRARGNKISLERIFFFFFFASKPLLMSQPHNEIRSKKVICSQYSRRRRVRTEGEGSAPNRTDFRPPPPPPAAVRRLGAGRGGGTS